MAPLSELPPPLNDEQDLPPDIRVQPPGPMSRAWSARLERVDSPAFLRRRATRAQGDVVFSSGRGANLLDVDGNRYVDLAAGFGALVLGHNPKPVLRAVAAQQDRMLQGLGDVFATDAKITLLERISGLWPKGQARVHLAQSGSEAVTVALKTAMLVTGKPGIVAFEGAYHGLGYAPLAACGLRSSYRAPFAEQLNPHVAFVPYPTGPEGEKASLAAVEAALRSAPTGAVLFEPILGRGGMRVARAEFIHALCELAHQFRALAIADEIWTGVGRSGSTLRTLELSAPVDLICIGKALGGGLPISACLGTDDVMQAWARADEVVHTSTFSGAPLACAAALATLDAVKFKRLPARSRELGDTLIGALRDAVGSHPAVAEIRGEGLMVGVELRTEADAAKCAAKLLQKGYIVLRGGVSGEVLTLTPSLTIDESVLVGVAGALRDALRS